MKRFCSILVCFLSLIPALHFSQPSRTPYLGTGYDLRVGNVEGKSLYTNDGDPGLKPTRYVAKPDGSEFSEVIAVDDWLTKEYLADDLIKYYTQIQDKWISSAEDELDTPSCEDSLYQHLHLQIPILKVGGSCKALQEAKKLLTVKKDVMVTKESSHIYMEARLRKLKYNLKYNPEFEKTVCNLMRTTEDSRKKKLTHFFKTWGTHVITELSLGQREIERKLFSEQDYFNVFFQTFSQNTSFDISSNYDVKFIPNMLESFSKIKPYENYKFVHGSKETPVPIRIHLEPISNFVLYVSCSEGVESKLTDPFSALKEMMEEYLASGYIKEDAPQFVNRQHEYVDLSVWPRGTFSLLKPNGNCPEGWSYGYRRHDTENNPGSRNSWHKDWKKLIDPSVNPNDSSFRLEFCTKTHQDPSREWGRGSYCIFKYGATCPAGFNTASYDPAASIYIEDEMDSNGNEMNGTLPSGYYPEKVTRYRTCCRNDGRYFPLFLPNDSPFVLLPVGYTCQPVFGMNSKLLWVLIHGEDTKAAYCAGSTSALCEIGTLNTLKIYFCYYEPISQV